MKTGTPARLDAKTINFELMEEQHGDSDIRRFSYLETNIPEKQLSCFITYTNEEAHNELKKGFKESPLYNGSIKSIGPRYCPSIETKLVTFSERDRHQLFLEPEGWNTNEYYINGFSSSLPLEIQYRALRKIRGLENVVIFRPGYAIEYDFYQPTQLEHSLESKNIENLFFAGQINGTTGYEEAAAQGLMAGINAVLKIAGKPAFVLKRNDAYIGVLIDDLVTKGVDEPYRMFTSRAEYRVLLRQDNADFRLTPMAIELGIAQEDRRKRFIERVSKREQLIRYFNDGGVTPEEADALLVEKGTSKIKQKVRYSELLLRPQLTIYDLLSLIKKTDPDFLINNIYDNDLLDAIEIEFKYNGYIEREKLLAEKLGRLDNIRIDKGIDFDAMVSISTEGRFKLKKYQPETLGEAARISGVSPSDINVLLLYIGR
jgi:tRNA uridine 5-carboxymethylaminomethyl modification enzyme